MKILRFLEKKGVPVGSTLLSLCFLFGILSQTALQDVLSKKVKTNLPLYVVGLIVVGFLALLCIVIGLPLNSRKMRRRHAFFENITSSLKKSEMLGVQFFRYKRTLNAAGLVYGINYIGGFVKDGVDANCMIGTEYVCTNKEIGHRIEKAFTHWNELSRKPISSLPADEYHIQYTVALNEIWDLYQTLIKECQKASDPIKTDSYYFYYRVIQVFAAILSGVPDDENASPLLDSLPPVASVSTDHGFLPDDKFSVAENERLANVEMLLRKGKRTGILGGVLFNREYAFNNLTSRNKRNRYYYCAPISTDYGDNLIAVLLYDKSSGAKFTDDDFIRCRNALRDICDSAPHDKMKGVLSNA